MNPKTKNIISIVAISLIVGVGGYFIGKNGSIYQTASIYNIKTSAGVTVSTTEAAQNQGDVAATTPVTCTKWVDNEKPTMYGSYVTGPCGVTGVYQAGGVNNINSTVELAQTLNNSSGGPQGLKWTTYQGMCFGWEQDEGGNEVIRYRFPGACPNVINVTQTNALQILSSPQIFIKTTRNNASSGN